MCEIDTYWLRFIIFLYILISLTYIMYLRKQIMGE